MAAQRRNALTFNMNGHILVPNSKAGFEAMAAVEAAEEALKKSGATLTVTTATKQVTVAQEPVADETQG